MLACLQGQGERGQQRAIGGCGAEPLFLLLPCPNLNPEKQPTGDRALRRRTGRTSISMAGYLEIEGDASAPDNLVTLNNLTQDSIVR